MSTQAACGDGNDGKCLLEKSTEESAAAALDTEGSREQIQRLGHRDILTMDPASKIEDVSTMKAAYVSPRTAGVRLRGIRGELMEKHITQKIREQVHAEFNPAPPKTDFCSTTRKDFTVEGFVPLTLETTNVHDYKSDQAITFWSENHQRIQGVTAVPSPGSPFKKSTLFSTPVAQRLDEPALPPES
ncbi:sperm-associated antigen 8 [Myripristis murdjan]|uniref:Sperm associated antigen 8 n=1 Tax=Myripristis murdjan TaxID=586833 RepID=A0A667Y2Y3_9TELE|nr:sperm-associated antigen 8-like [Myripristis murdjan]